MWGSWVRGEMLARGLEQKVRIRETEDAVLPYNEGLGRADAEAALKAVREHREDDGE